jgi:hypothetical protein
MKKAILILLFSVLVFIMSGSSVMALYQTIYPEQDFPFFDRLIGGSRFSFVGCNETRVDGVYFGSYMCVREYMDGKYMYRDTERTAQIKLFEMTNLTNISESTIVDRIQLQWRAKRYSTTYDSFTPALFVSDGSPDGLAFYNETREIQLGGAWKFYTMTYYRNPLTGAAWTANQVNTLKAGMYLKYPFLQGGYFDHFRIYVYYR